MQFGGPANIREISAYNKSNLIENKNKYMLLLLLLLSHFSRVLPFATPWTIAYQAPQSMGFSRQEYWSGLPFPSPGDLPDPGIEPRSPTLQADALTSEPPGKPNKHLRNTLILASVIYF